MALIVQRGEEIILTTSSYMTAVARAISSATAEHPHVKIVNGKGETVFTYEYRAPDGPKHRCLACGKLACGCPQET